MGTNMPLKTAISDAAIFAGAVTAASIPSIEPRAPIWLIEYLGLTGQEWVWLCSVGVVLLAGLERAYSMHRDYLDIRISKLKIKKLESGD